MWDESSFEDILEQLKKHRDQEIRDSRRQDGVEFTKSVVSKERTACLSGDPAALEFIAHAADKVAQMPAWKRGVLEALCAHFKEEINPVRAVLPNICDACAVYRKAFEKDPDFFGVYQDNVAMLLYDHAGPQFKDPEFRNDIAARILKLLFWC
jgi:hypothetical protein